MNELRHLSFVAAGNMLRTATHNGREHLVVPVVALMEGVIQAVNSPVPEFVPSAELAIAPGGWDGRPCLPLHPSKNGIRVSANNPEILAAHKFGEVFDAKFDGGKLKMEAWLDTVRAAELGGDAQKVITRLRAGQTIEVSVGAFVNAEAKQGEWQGKAYKAVWHGIVPDHLALLPEGTLGACSNRMGCGAPRTASQAEVRDAGGPGSGNFGHGGRPGEVGGSGEGGGGKDKGDKGGKGRLTPIQAKHKLIEEHAKEADRLGVEIHNFGAGQDRYGIYSKTSAGGFESTINPKTGEVEHNWHEGRPSPGQDVHGLVPGMEAEITVGGKPVEIQISKATKSGITYHPVGKPKEKTTVTHDKMAELVGAEGVFMTMQSHRAADRLETLSALLTLRDIPQSERDKMPESDFAGPGTSFPIKTQADVDAAAKLVGQAADPAAVKKRIIAIAKRKGLTIPKAWQEELKNAQENHMSLRDKVKALLKGAASGEADTEDTAEMVQFTTIKTLLEQISTTYDSAVALVMDLLADEAKETSPTATAEDKAAEDEIEGARLDSLQSYCLEMMGTISGVLSLARKLTEADRPALMAMAENLRANAGKRNSAADQQTIQMVHDHSVKLGAECAKVKAAEEHADDTHTPDAGKETVNMAKAELIAALIGCSKNPLTEADKPALEAMSEQTLTALQERFNQPIPEMKAAEAPKELSEEQFMKAAPQRLRDLITKQDNADKTRKTELVGQLKTAQSEYSEEELNGMSVEQLERLAKVAKVPEPNFTGRGLPRAAAGQETYVPPDGYALALEAQSKK